MSDGGVWFESIGPIFWGYFHGEYSDEGFASYIEAAEAAMLSPGFGGAVLTIAHAPRMPNAMQRKSLAVLASRTGRQHVTRHAISSDSRVARCVVTAMNWLTSKPFDERIFDSPHGALDWLSSGAPAVGEGLWARIRDVVPPSRQL
jgi:hypothetical protein